MVEDTFLKTIVPGYSRRVLRDFFMKISDSYFMEKAINLGWQGMNLTSPNPRVGCVITKNGKIIGTGFHKKFGSEHAEINAINSAAEDLKNSTMFVTLEPCSHFGKTPPCIDRIIASGISRVVVALKDINPVIKGIEKLKEKGLKVETGVLKDEANELVRGYYQFVKNKKPFVIVKAALSWDGKIATKTGESQWISNEPARKYSMSLRGMNDAVLIGVGTVRCDNPELTYRLDTPLAKDPLRVILDPDLTIKVSAKILSRNTLIFTSEDSDKEKIKLIEDKGAEIIQVETENKYILPATVLKELYKKNIISLLVEGGGMTIGNFIDAGVVDRIIFVYGSMIIGGKDAPTACDGSGIQNIKKSRKLVNIKRIEVGDNIIMQGDLS